MSKVTIMFEFEVHDEAEVVKVGDKVIKDGWGIESIAAYMDGDKDISHAAQALYEILSAGLWTTLERYGAPDGRVEIVNDEVHG